MWVVREALVYLPFSAVAVLNTRRLGASRITGPDGKWWVLVLNDGLFWLSGEICRDFRTVFHMGMVCPKMKTFFGGKVAAVAIGELG